MKTREIEAYCCSYALESFEAHKNGSNIRIRNNPSPYDIKVKIIVEIPDRKIEITESQLDEAFDRAREFDSLKDVKHVLWMELFRTEE